MSAPLLALLLAPLVGVPACANRTTTPPGAISGSDGDVPNDGTSDGGLPDEPGGGDPVPADGGAVTAACATRVSYGRSWIHPAQHPDPFDVAAGRVTWDGACTDDAGNSYALLSNGWKPYFAGASACTVALDDNCQPPASGCTTRIHYGATWLAAPNHPASFDDVAGRVTWDGACHAAGADSYATLSNGWQPHFAGGNGCSLSFAHRGCGGLYANPVVDGGCADPGVLYDGGRYIMTCTSGGAATAFPIRVSTDLVHWTGMGAVFPSGKRPAWATGDFWAPEIHKVGAHYVAYYSARAADGKLSIGAASAATALGPFTDRGTPLLHDEAMGLIDVSELEALDGTRYLLWKEDGNAVGKPTPIRAQKLADDGLSLVGQPTTLITNDRAWEGSVVEGPWMLVHGGRYYLFYSGNAYYDGTYAVGVASAASPLGPFTKMAAPILVTGGEWVGPGHCSVLDLPDGETVMIYHAWRTGQVNGAGDVRYPLVDRVSWSGGVPLVPAAPSSRSVPLP